MIRPVRTRKAETRLRSCGLEWQERREHRAARAKRGEGVSAASGSRLFFFLAPLEGWRP